MKGMGLRPSDDRLVRNDENPNVRLPNRIERELSVGIEPFCLANAERKEVMAIGCKPK